MGKEGPHYTFTKTKYNHSDAADESMFKKTVNYPGPGSYGPKIVYQSDTPIYTMSKLKERKLEVINIYYLVLDLININQINMFVVQ